jgi:ribonuclease BN (tRNA processing enzyme)
MKLILGGVRGTNPVAQPEFMKYGGETTSFLVEGAAGERILIDAGTGVRELGRRMQAAEGRRLALLLMTHYHLDHIMGLPSLGLIYSPEWSLEIAAPAHEDVVVAATMSRIMARPFWPLQITDLESRLRFTALEGPVPANPMVYGELRVSWCPIHHPGGCSAYRIDEPASGSSVVIATDLEWAESTPSEREAFLRLCATPGPADVLLLDAQYTSGEYERYRGWGHSTWEQAVELAAQVKAERLLITHHDPAKNDVALDAVRAAVRARSPGADLARERMEIDLGRH